MITSTICTISKRLVVIYNFLVDSLKSNNKSGELYLKKLILSNLYNSRV